MTDPRIRTREVKRLINIRKVEITTVLTAVVILGGFALWLIGEARASNVESKTAASAATQQVKELGVRFDHAEDRHAKEHQEIQMDVRAVYKHLLTGQRQGRLDRPPEPVPP
jgi:cytoskeletal protein RodZ